MTASAPTAFTKSSPTAPRGYFAWEAAGLTWLRDAHETAGGPPVPAVQRVGETELVIDRVAEARPSRASAHAFGEALASLHASGAGAFGAPPPGHSGDGFFGPLDDPRPMPLRSRATFGEFWWCDRIEPCVRELRWSGALTAEDARAFAPLADRLADGAFAPPHSPTAASRVHGDLWSGNVLWSPVGVTLIDPSAHGGHPYEDLAMLALFGAPELTAIFDAYERTAGLPAGWRDELAVHALYGVLMHAVLFGGGYASQALATAKRFG